MHEQLLGFCNAMLTALKVTPEQLAEAGGPDGFAEKVGRALIDNGLRLAVVEEADDDGG